MTFSNIKSLFVEHCIQIPYISDRIIALRNSHPLLVPRLYALMKNATSEERLTAIRSCDCRIMHILVGQMKNITCNEIEYSIKLCHINTLVKLFDKIFIQLSDSQSNGFDQKMIDKVISKIVSRCKDINMFAQIMSSINQSTPGGFSCYTDRDQAFEKFILNNKPSSEDFAAIMQICDPILILPVFSLVTPGSNYLTDYFSSYTWDQVRVTAINRCLPSDIPALISMFVKPSTEERIMALTMCAKDNIPDLFTLIVNPTLAERYIALTMCKDMLIPRLFSIIKNPSYQERAIAIESCSSSCIPDLYKLLSNPSIYERSSLILKCDPLVMSILFRYIISPTQTERMIGLARCSRDLIHILIEQFVAPIISAEERIFALSTCCDKIVFRIVRHLGQSTRLSQEERNIAITRCTTTHLTKVLNEIHVPTMHELNAAMSRLSVSIFMNYKLSVTSCSVCLEKMQNSLVVTNKCGHVFHFRCIDKWRKISAQFTCPYCRCAFVEADYDTAKNIHLIQKRTVLYR